MRILISPDGFTGSLTATEVASAIAAGWHRQAPGDELRVLGLSDGGPGFVDVIGKARRIEPMLVSVPGPRGLDVPAMMIVDEDPRRGMTAYLESAQVCGLDLTEPAQRNPWTLSSRGLGYLIGYAIDAGAQRIVIGLGGTGTVDAGAGLLAALGATSATVESAAESPSPLLEGPAGFTAITAVDISRAIERAASVEIHVAADVDVCLTGPQGAVLGFARQKFAEPDLVTDDQIAQLAHAVGSFVDAVQAGRSDLTHAPHTGAAGGIGWALATIGATLFSGFDTVSRIVDLFDHVAWADLIITGEGRLDWQTPHGKVVAGVAQAALAHGVPVLAMAGSVELGQRELAAMNIVEAHGLVDLPGGMTEAMAHPVDALERLSQRVATQWSR